MIRHPRRVELDSILLSLPHPWSLFFASLEIPERPSSQRRVTGPETCIARRFKLQPVCFMLKAICIMCVFWSVGV